MITDLVEIKSAITRIREFLAYALNTPPTGRVSEGQQQALLQAFTRAQFLEQHIAVPSCPTCGRPKE